MNRRLNKVLAWASGDTGLKIFSVLFAVGLWLFVNAGQKPTEKSLTVPVEVRNMPADLMMGSPGPGQVEVRVSGPPALLSTLDPDRLKVVLDLDGARPGTSTFRLSPGFFEPPRGVRIARISPAVINLKLETRGERVLPVTVRLGSKPPPGYKIVRADASPDSVKVLGPANTVNRMTSVETLPIDLEGTKGQATKEVRLSSSDETLTFTPEKVAVTIVLEEEAIAREFSRLDVRARNVSGKYNVTPRQAYIKVSGPKRVVDDLKLGPEQVYLDLKGLGPGAHTVALTLNLPREVKVVEQKPDRFRVTISGRGA
ncbi:MAG TPA: CdaR family protein [Candidatus Binatia bacterium]|nr:CdaR family protein [Candidatus Binatia bacterium]